MYSLGTKTSLQNLSGIKELHFSANSSIVKLLSFSTRLSPIIYPKFIPFFFLNYSFPQKKKKNSNCPKQQSGFTRNSIFLLFQGFFFFEVSLFLSILIHQSEAIIHNNVEQFLENKNNILLVQFVFFFKKNFSNACCLKITVIFK